MVCKYCKKLMADMNNNDKSMMQHVEQNHSHRLWWTLWATVLICFYLYYSLNHLINDLRFFIKISILIIYFN